MNAALLAALGILCFVIAMKVYARWIERRVYEMDTDEPTPAHATPDGIDFVACNRHVLFGHHFCSVAGAAPIVGPAIAVIWGWLPALLWVVFGTIFIGAVHDFGALALSAKRGGRTIGDLAGDLLGPRAKVWFLGIIVLLTWIVIAVFAYLIAFLFGHPTKGVPQSVLPINFEILVAVLIGWWIYKRKGKLLLPSILAVAALYGAVFVCAGHPEWGRLPDSLCLYGSAVVTWIVFLLVYSYVASVLPVRVLLQPRDYINSHQLFLGLGGAAARASSSPIPQVTAPAINAHVDPAAPPDDPAALHHHRVRRDQRLPRAGGQRDDLQATRPHAAMRAPSATAACSARAPWPSWRCWPPRPGCGSAEHWQAQYSSWKRGRQRRHRPLRERRGVLPRPVVGGNVALAKTVVAVIVISFAATTLDTAARIQRFCLAELGESFGWGFLRNRFLSGAVAVVPAGLLAIFTDGGRGPGSGGFILWPVFGTTNQLIGAVTLLVLLFHLRTRRRPVLPVAVPLVFLVIMTTTAGILGLKQEIARGNTVVVAFGGLFLLLEALVFYEALRTWLRGAPLVAAWPSRVAPVGWRAHRSEGFVRMPFRFLGHAAVVVLLFLACAPASAHVVRMNDGTEYEGKILSQDDDEVVIQTTFDGTKHLARADVKSVDTSVPPLRDQLAYRAKTANDVKSRWDLYHWAKDNGFKKELLYILQAIVDLKPGDRRARKLLGHKKVDGKWMSPEEEKKYLREKFEAEQRAKGLVPYEGGWVTPEERDAREKGLLKDGDEWITEEEYHRRRGERLVNGTWIKVGYKEGEALCAEAIREGRVKVAYHWSPHFDALAEVKPELAKHVLDACEKGYGVLRRTLHPTPEDYPETKEERILLALLLKMPGYVRFSRWFAKRFDADSLTPGWANAVQRMKGWWWIQDVRAVCVYQFPNTDKTLISNALHDAALVMLTRYKANFAAPSVWLRQGWAYYVELQAIGYSESFTLGRGGGTGAAANGEQGPVWLDASKWKGALQGLVNQGQDPPMRRIARMTLDQFRYVELVKSWSIIDFLMAWDPVKFKRFIDLSKDRSKDEEVALKEAFGVDFRHLDEKWRAYVTAGFKKGG